MPPSSSARAPARLFRIALAASLTLSALLFFLWSWRWPLVGDASLIHYIAFLIERHWAPYAQLGDMNMPGSYLIEIAAMRIFGMNALAWRLFDFTLLAIASTAFVTITGRINWLSALFSASLFILIHGRDGLAEGGQRDLTMAVLLIAANAFLFLAVRKPAIRRNSLWATTAFGLLSGLAATIKPTTLLLTLAQLLIAARVSRETHNLSSTTNINKSIRGIAAPFLAPASLAYLIAPVIALIFLLREHALTAFLAGFHGIIPYYASLGHRPLSFVILHSISPLLPLVLAWLAVLALLRPHLDWERATLLAGVLFGLLNCIVQQRALPYYRYPLLVFLLPLMAIDFTRTLYPATEPGTPFVTASSSRVGSARAVWSTRATTAIATLALAYAAFFLAPQSAILIHRYRWWETDFISTLEQNLNTLGGTSLSGHIQCIDSISGCGNVLYRMRLEPATGVLSDFLLFGPDTAPIVRQTREQLSSAILANPPQVIVVSSHLHIDGPDNFEKLARWPAFATFLATRYTLRTQWSPTRTARWWSREETPASYRIYTLRPDTSVLATEQRGTVIVVSQSRDRVIMAADSRVGLTNDGINIHGVDDGKCKLAALSGNLIFGASGLIGNSATGWSAASVAMDTAAAASAPTDRDKGRQILVAWSESMIQKIVLDFTPEQIRATARQNEGGLTTGILAGIGPEETAWAQVSQIRSSESDIRQLHYEIASPISVKRQAFYFFGKTEIAAEFNAGISGRSKREKAQWSRMRLGDTAFDEFKARRLAELTIQLYPDKTAVGGPVDEVELDGQGPRWIALKKNCGAGDAGHPTRNSH